MLSGSARDWTYVRLLYLMSGPATGNSSVAEDYLPGQQITGVDLGRFLVSQLTSRPYSRQALFIANGSGR